MKKYSWIVALLLALSLAFFGCPSPGDDDDDDDEGPLCGYADCDCGDDCPGEGCECMNGEGPVEPTGPEWGDELGMKPTMYGNNQPVWSDENGGTITITASSSTGFSWTWAQLSEAAGVTINRTTGNLFVYYVIDVETPVAVLTFKDPGNFSGDAAGSSDWGKGKGREYVLGDDSAKNLSNYDKTGGRIVAGHYNPETGRGWFEIDPTVFTNSTGVGFQHNYWCDMESAPTKIAENSKYTLKIISITLGEPVLDVKVNIGEIHGVTPPVRGHDPVTAITEATQYTGTVTWDPAIAEGGTFAASTEYTATITLTAKSGFTFDGVEEDFFTVAGATATNPASSGVVTAVFPETLAEGQDITVSIFAIAGVTAPVAGETPVTAITATDQYTGTVTWASGDPATALTGNFDYATAYTATITLIAEESYTFTGVEENAFTLTGITGATVTNPADSGVITAVFPATLAEGQDAPVTIFAIAGVTVPAVGAAPVAAITATDQYAGTVTWSPAVTGTFAYGTAYTATIELTAAEGFTFEGVEANSFTVAGAAATNPANSGVVTAVFPATTPFVAVTDITDVPTSGLVSTDITLGGTVAPATATNKTIVWSLASDNALTDATLTSGVLKSNVSGTAKVTATITDGTAVGTAFTKNFEVTITGFLVSDPVLVKKEGVGQTWNAANTENADGSFTIKAGLVVCEFDFTDGEGDGVDKYDFVEIFYTATGANSSGFKVYNTINDIGGSYRNVSSGNNSIKLELKYCGGGFGIQKYQEGSGDMTIKITKLVFTKGTRYPITFSLGTYTGADPAPTTPTYLVDGTQVGTLPAAPYWVGKLFTGWYNGTSAVVSTTTVNASFNNAVLTAGWEDEPTVADFTVAFTAGDDTPFTGSVGSTVTISNITANGFAYDQTGGYGPYVMFKITLPDNARLAYFDKINLTWQGTGGDTGSKQLQLVASPTATTSAAQGQLNGGTLFYGQTSVNGNTAQNVSINIDKGKAFANLTSNELWIGFYLHAGALSYTVTNIELVQNP